MKRITWIGRAAWALLACAGCSAATEQEAKLLVVPARWTGQLMEISTGGSGLLLKRDRITSHRRVKTGDGVEIDTWVLHSRLYDRTADNQGSLLETKVTRGTVVLLHPLLAGKAWFLGLGQDLADRGWDVVLPDIRAHGYSGGDYITWGAREKNDLKGLMDALLVEEPISDRIYVCGSSLGGSVAIQYAAIEPRCMGVIAMSPPAEPVDVFRRILWLESETRFEAAVRRAADMAGFDPNNASAVAAAGKLSCPLVVIRGQWDVLVPSRHGEAIYGAATTAKRLVTLRYAGHVVELGRGGWVARQMDTLAAMDGEVPPQYITRRLPPPHGGPVAQAGAASPGPITRRPARPAESLPLTMILAAEDQP